MTTLKDRRATLLGRLKELDSRLHSIEAELDVEHSKDWEDSATEREGEEVLESLGAAGQEEIRRIQAALRRMREGEYGVCAECGGDISQERLDVLPATPFCKTCAVNHG